MSNSSIKSRIYQMVDDIKDETILNQLMEDVAFYADRKDITSYLTPEQLNELDAAIEEADNNDTVSLDDLKKEMNGWRQK